MSTHKQSNAQSRREYISLAGLRQDGRRPHEWRPTSLCLGVFSTADGSASLSVANTKVIAAVYGPKAPSSGGGSGTHSALDGARTMSLKCSVVVAAFSRQQHRIQRTNDRRSTALAYLVENTFRPNIFCHAYPSSELEIHVQVLEDNGGLECAICNAVSAALLDAHVPMRDILISSNVAIVQQVILVDPTREESVCSTSELFYCTYANAPREIVSVTMERRVSEEDLALLMESGAAACVAFYGAIKPILKERVEMKLLHLQRGKNAREVAEENEIDDV